MENSILIFLYILSICAGVGVGYWLGVRDVKELDKEDPEHSPHYIETRKQVIARQVAWGVLALLVIFTVTQAYASLARDREQVAQNSAQVEKQANCNQVFLDGLENRARLNSEDQALDRDDSAQLRNAIRLLLLPPPEGTTREDYNRGILIQLDARLQSNDDQRIANEAERQQNPTRPPECEGIKPQR